jgi:hypothetical protein
MGAFSKKTIKIENPGVWKDGEYVKIRTRQNVSDQQAIRAALLERVPDISNLSDSELMKHGLDAQVVILQRMIAEWKLFDDEGDEVECTPETIAELDGDYGDYIIAHMNDDAARVGDAMSEKEQEDFLASASGRSKESS